MADPKTEDRSDEMEDNLHKLEDHITDAEKKLEARKEDAAIADEVTGEPESAPTGEAGEAPPDEERADEASPDPARE